MQQLTVRALSTCALLAMVVHGGAAQAPKANPPLRINFRALTDEGQEVVAVRREGQRYRIIVIKRAEPHLKT